MRNQTQCCKEIYIVLDINLLKLINSTHGTLKTHDTCMITLSKGSEFYDHFIMLTEVKYSSDDEYMNIIKN